MALVSVPAIGECVEEAESEPEPESVCIYIASEQTKVAEPEIGGDGNVSQLRHRRVVSLMGYNCWPKVCGKAYRIKCGVFRE